MPVSKPEPVRELIEEGDHLLTLKSVRERDMPSFNDPNKLEPKWIWVFHSQRVDSTGEPQVLTVVSGSTYGNPKATLTALLDFLAPKLTREQKSNLDTAVLEYQTYKCRIKHENGQNPGDPKRARFLYFEPFNVEAALAATTPAASAAVTDDDEKDDPFANE